MTLSRYDRWKTQGPPEPDDECPDCGTPYHYNADEVALGTCDGKPGFAEHTYTEADAGLLDIIGWDHLGETYTVTFPAACGDEVQHEPHPITEIAEDRYCECSERSETHTSRRGASGA